MKTDQLLTGDLIGVAGVESDWGTAIMVSSKRQVYTIYDHVGMLENRKGEVFVWNSNPHDGVIAEPLQVFINREEVQIEKNFDLFRLNVPINFNGVLEKMTKLQGLPYNFSFLQSDKKYYCSDFVSRTFPEGIFPLEGMHFAGDFWEEYYAKQGIEKIPEGQPGINPNDMFAQSNVDFINDLRSII
ncbi:YiiX/YebB-like N1pC/P60 family cysteine hydrolase [Lactovum miscens]|uniref:Permuted papain-like amidase enzyme, YaeF/YiiX, C92 family n=1 Tax=Lactovum miscens TaxID=190387 RepID=A0A841C7J6_9LACT|nr:YiiX/YebB-like N1pC/P60 family cysteine hydrolase [Lactovum miscens]MBB5887562.1 hypothetical protein [Lactovum miscens]